MQLSRRQLAVHLLAVFLTAACVVVLFLRAPGLGDDLTYWQLAFELHEKGADAWDPSSFHDLRWPVWGVCWLLQAALGPGLTSYYGVPVLYFALGAVVSFLFARIVFRNNIAGWAAAIAFLFHPLLDPVSYRPMPDLSEAALGGLTMLCWYGMMTLPGRAQRCVLSVLTGVVVAVLFANRLTGLFIIPVLVVCTLALYPRRFHWLVLSAAVALATVALESYVYWTMTSDFLHSLHANLGAKGRKGTESVALWSLPFRFADSLWESSNLAPAYVLLGAAGGISLWRSRAVVGRAIVLWFIVLYLGYSCAIQGINPVRPLLRDADRFLAGCAIPMTIMAVAGGWWLLQTLHGFSRTRRAIEWILRHRALSAAGAIVLLILGSDRHFFDIDYVPRFQAYVGSLESGTLVLTHHSMRAISFLIAPRESARLDWYHKHWIIEREDKLEAAAERADEIWYARKLAWLGVRKALERNQIEEPVEFASYVAQPQENWRLAEVISRDDDPDFVFLKRRKSGDPPAHVLKAADAGFPGGPVALPVEWHKEKKAPRDFVFPFPVPEDLRGRRIYLDLRATSGTVQAARAFLAFAEGEKTLRRYELKLYFQPEKGKDYFAMEIPSSATSGQVEIKIMGSTKWIRLSDLSVVIFERAERSVKPDDH